MEQESGCVPQVIRVVSLGYIVWGGIYIKVIVETMM